MRSSPRLALLILLVTTIAGGCVASSPTVTLPASTQPLPATPSAAPPSASQTIPPSATPATTDAPTPAPANVTLPAPTQAGLVPGAAIGAACPLFLLADHVHGTLAGDPGDAAWPIWLAADDGTPQYVRWPEGFTVRFDPEPSLLDGTGKVVAAHGSKVDLGQVAPTSARGTMDDPYVASGVVFATCYVEKPSSP